MLIIFGHKWGLFAKMCGEAAVDLCIQAVYSLTIKSEPWIYWLKWM